MPIEAEHWNLYWDWIDRTRVVLVSFDFDAAREDAHTGYACGRRVVIVAPPDQVEPGGLPARALEARLEALRAALVDALERRAIRCRLVGRLTGDTRRELVFQVEDVDSAGFDDVVSAWSRTAANLRVATAGYAGWEYFDEVIRPRRRHWRQIHDREVLTALKDAGSDLAREHFIECRFYGSASGLEGARARLEADGFALVHADDGCLVMGYSMAPTERNIWSTICHMLDIADASSVEYDGWETAVIPLDGN